MNDGRNWMITGGDKLHMCATLAETITLLQESIYNDAANIFGHL